MVSTSIDYVAGRLMARLPPGAERRPYLVISLIGNLGILGFFKYYNFFVESAVGFSEWMGLALPARTLEIILPIGISFYTFQTLSYTVDVYRGRLTPTRSMLDFALFVAFFPQLVAGPILRARTFLPQLLTMHRLAEVNFRAHLTLFLVGYIKKACVADQVAQVVDPVFASPELYSAASHWLASLLYSLQIYCDFSGYSDMAIACAGLLGYRVTENFAFPYLARSFRDYWRRWHISLSTWFRDYLYVPLGGNRGSTVRVWVNLWIVFLLCSLWHGADWTFVAWGVWQGLFLSLERVVRAERLPSWLGHLYLLLGVNLGLVIFRAQDLPTAWTYLKGMLGAGPHPSPGPLVGVDPAWWLILAGFAVVHVWLSRRPVEERVRDLPSWLFALGLGAAVALALPWAAWGYQPFIYFQF
jgi:alginate O-acetyltransferase complex protein AlgI